MDRNEYVRSLLLPEKEMQKNESLELPRCKLECNQGWLDNIQEVEDEDDVTGRKSPFSNIPPDCAQSIHTVETMPNEDGYDESFDILMKKMCIFSKKLFVEHVELSDEELDRIYDVECILEEMLQKVVAKADKRAEPSAAEVCSMCAGESSAGRGGGIQSRGGLGSFSVDTHCKDGQPRNDTTSPDDVFEMKPKE